MVLIELGCEDDSELTEAVRPDCLAVRITEQDDFTRKSTRRAVHGIIRLCELYGVEVHVWVSIPCTAGCPWRSDNDKLGRPTGDLELTERLIKAAVAACHHVSKIGGTFSWEWPHGNHLWKNKQVSELVAKRKARRCLASTAALGMKFPTKGHPQDENIEFKDAQTMLLRKQWEIATSHQGIAQALERYAKVPDAEKGEVFVECRGRLAKASARYTPLLADTVWTALRPAVPRVMMIAEAPQVGEVVKP